MLIYVKYFCGSFKRCILVIQSEIKLVTHCYTRLLYLRIIHLILQAASGPGIICDFRDSEKTLKAVYFFR